MPEFLFDNVFLVFAGNIFEQIVGMHLAQIMTNS